MTASANDSTSLDSTKLPYSELEAKTLVRFSKNISCLRLPISKTCGPTCLSGDSNHKLFYIFHTLRLKKFSFNFMIHYNDSAKQIIVSFSGPSLKFHPEYLNHMYSKGFNTVKELRGAGIEKEYHQIYFGKLRKILLEKISKVIKSGRANYDYVFNGHSIGGAVATLAALDLIMIKKINSNKSKVYTYGATRIGNEAFSKLINAELSLFRVVKKNDFIVKAPSCYFIRGPNVWKCMNNTLVTNFYAYLFTSRVVALPALIIRLTSFVKFFTVHQAQLQTKILDKYKHKRDEMIKHGHKQITIQKHPSHNHSHKKNKNNLEKRLKTKKPEDLKKILNHKRDNKEKKHGISPLNHHEHHKKHNEHHNINKNIHLPHNKQEEKRVHNGISALNHHEHNKKHNEHHNINKNIHLPHHKQEEKRVHKPLKHELKSIRHKNNWNKIKMPNHFKTQNHNNMKSRRPIQRRPAQRRSNNNNSRIRSQINRIRSQINNLRSRKGPRAASLIQSLEAQLRRLESQLHLSFLQISSKEELQTDRSSMIVTQYTPVFRNLIYYNESVFNLQPLGQVVYYDDVFRTHQICTNCSRYSVSVPQTFTYDSHKSYFGENFDC